MDSLDYALADSVHKLSASGESSMLLQYEHTVGNQVVRTVSPADGIFIGDQTKITCNIMPEVWVNPDPPSFKALVGKCQRTDLTAIEHVINEGVVASSEDCQTICTNNPKECTAH